MAPPLNLNNDVSDKPTHGFHGRRMSCLTLSQLSNCAPSDPCGSSANEMVKSWGFSLEVDRNKGLGILRYDQVELLWLQSMHGIISGPAFGCLPMSSLLPIALLGSFTFLLHFSALLDFVGRCLVSVLVRVASKR